MKIKNISDYDGIYKVVNFSKEELEGNYVELINKMTKEGKEGFNVFYTNLSKGGVDLKNKIVEQVDGVLETGFVKRKNGKVYYKVVLDCKNKKNETIQ